MKHLKRIVTLILAGVLTLTLFTGCAASFSTQFENAFMDMVNQRRAAGQEELTNDPVLRVYAEQLLNNIVDWETGEIKESGVRINNHTKMNGKNYMDSILIPSTVSAGTAFATEITPEKLQKVLNDNQNGYSDTAYSNCVAVGVAARTLHGKTYYAYGVRYEVNYEIS